MEKLETFAHKMSKASCRHANGRTRLAMTAIRQRSFCKNSVANCICLMRAVKVVAVRLVMSVAAGSKAAGATLTLASLNLPIRWAAAAVVAFPAISMTTFRSEV